MLNGNKRSLHLSALTFFDAGWIPAVVCIFDIYHQNGAESKGESLGPHMGG